MANFIARVEFRLPPGGNNGLAIRSPGTGDPAYVAMTELQVLDSEHPKYAKLDPRQYHGSCLRHGRSQAWVPARCWPMEFPAGHRRWQLDQGRIERQS